MLAPDLTVSRTGHKALAFDQRMAALSSVCKYRTELYEVATDRSVHHPHERFVLFKARRATRPTGPLPPGDPAVAELAHDHRVLRARVLAKRARDLGRELPSTSGPAS